MSFTAPVKDMLFLLHSVAGLRDLQARGLAPGVDADLLTALFDQAGRFAGDALAPLNQPGDRIGAQYRDGAVTMPPGFKDAYQAWTEGGWNGVDFPEQWGGLGLPIAVATPLMEIWSSANMAFAMGTVLTQGAVEALLAHSSEELKAHYVPKLVSGEWAGTMNMTEPQAGSDVGATRTRAEPAGDGRYRLKGQKIFISYGDHDMTANIVHLVLARLPGAPEGTKGLSLFLVPKFLPDGTRNDLLCAGIEHKLGIHASPTCTMVYGDKEGAIGWLIGSEHKGMECMFTMMNRARLVTGLQGIALAERAMQQAYAFARTRIQGRAPGAATSSPIIEHPDVRRMLLEMRAGVLAARAMAYSAAIALDLSHRAPDEAERESAATRAALMTPIVKAFGSETGFEVASLGVQVHGGMGYIEETGAAQHMRDARVPMIYEGTNGIQAIDLVTRKIVQDGGGAAGTLIEELKAIARSGRANPDAAIAAVAERLDAAQDALKRATQWLLQPKRNRVELLAVATPYLRLFATVLGGGLLLKGALDDASDAPFARPADYLIVTRHYADTRLILAAALSETITSYSGTLMEAEVLAYGEGQSA
jgi:alkylation response protein AidB-like acyl-CoA dehydrogenase